jgi:non-ribosomal peptide synthetase component F
MEILQGRHAATEATALIDLTLGAARKLSFAWLDAHAARLELVLRPLLPECAVVGLLSRRSAEAIAGLLAIWRVGAIYLPLDPECPSVRLRFLLEDARPAALLVQVGVAVDASLPPIGVVRLETAAFECAAHAEGVRGGLSLIHPDASDCAYILYTSGSTGSPKGVLGSREALRRRCNWMWEAYPFAVDGCELCAQKTAATFVDSLWETVGPLGAGVPLLLLPQELMAQPSRLAHVIDEWRVTRLVLVPAALGMLLDASEEIGSGDRSREGATEDASSPSPGQGGRLESLRLVSVSGDAFPLRLAARALRRMPRAKVSLLPSRP